MKPILLSLFTWLISLQAFALQIADTSSESTIAIKGKILPWTVALFPFSGVNYTMGIEYGFNKVNAIGAEFVYNDNNTHRHYASDSAGPSAYSVNRAVFIYYKRYFKSYSPYIDRTLQHALGGEILPYVTAFARYGKRDLHYEKDFETNNITHDEWQYSAGLLFGLVRNFFDINMGPFYKQSYISITDNINGDKVQSQYMRPSFGFRIGVNLFYVAKRKSNHYLANYARHDQDLRKAFSKK